MQLYFGAFCHFSSHSLPEERSVPLPSTQPLRLCNPGTAFLCQRAMSVHRTRCRGAAKPAPSSDPGSQRPRCSSPAPLSAVSCRESESWSRCVKKTASPCKVLWDPDGDVGLCLHQVISREKRREKPAQGGTCVAADWYAAPCQWSSSAVPRCPGEANLSLVPTSQADLIGSACR